MGADILQSLGVVLIVLAAVTYLLVRARRTLKGGGCGDGLCHPPSTEPGRERSNAGQPFVPAENLAARAKRLARARNGEGEDRSTT